MLDNMVNWKEKVQIRNFLGPFPRKLITRKVKQLITATMPDNHIRNRVPNWVSIEWTHFIIHTAASNELSSVSSSLLSA